MSVDLKFSIITPCYNAEKYIGEMINSVLSQTYDNFELIIVNDGSTDNSVAVIETFQDPRIKLINQKNSGKPSIPRNVALEIADGDLVCFLDADDTYSKEKLALIHQLFLDYENTAYVVHDYSRCNEDLTPVVDSFTHSNVTNGMFLKLFSKCGDATYVINDGYYKFGLFDTPLVSTNSITIKKSRLIKTKKLHFREDMTCTEDLMLWNQIITTESGLYYDQVLSTYRDSTASVTDNKYQFDLDTYQFFKENLTKPLVTFSGEEMQELKRKATEDILSAAYYQSGRNAGLSLMLYREALAFNFSYLTIKQSLKSLIKITYRTIFK